MHPVIWKAMHLFAFMPCRAFEPSEKTVIFVKRLRWREPLSSVVRVARSWRGTSLKNCLPEIIWILVTQYGKRGIRMAVIRR